MIPPKAFKYFCTKCGYTKIVKPKSDVLTPIEISDICPKCKSKMKKRELNLFEEIITFFK
jgi:Zn finger protein HypA/HybF involved in hydrogenase expression